MTVRDVRVDPVKLWLGRPSEVHRDARLVHLPANAQLATAAGKLDDPRVVRRDRRRRIVGPGAEVERRVRRFAGAAVHAGEARHGTGPIDTVRRELCVFMALELAGGVGRCTG